MLVLPNLGLPKMGINVTRGDQPGYWSADGIKSCVLLYPAGSLFRSGRQTAPSSPTLRYYHNHGSPFSALHSSHCCEQRICWPGRSQTCSCQETKLAAKPSAELEERLCYRRLRASVGRSILGRLGERSRWQLCRWQRVPARKGYVSESKILRDLRDS